MGKANFGDDGNRAAVCQIAEGAIWLRRFRNVLV